MTYTRVALVFGGLAVVALCVLGAIGFKPAIAVLVTVALLVLFVAAGNLISGRPGQPRFARPRDPDPEPASGAPGDPPATGAP